MEFVLTKEMLQGAKTYMPLATKRTLAQEVAYACVVPMKRVKWDGIHIIPQDEVVEDGPTSLPDLMEEDIALKMCLLQNVLLSYYFDIEMDPAEDAYALFDHYAGSHLLNQLERFKSDRDVKNIAFDLTEDWREFKKMVDTIIYNYKMAANDPLKRFDAMLTVFSSPENIKAAAAELQKAGNEMEGKIKGAKSAKKQKGDKVLKPIPESEPEG